MGHPNVLAGGGQGLEGSMPGDGSKHTPATQQPPSSKRSRHQQQKQKQGEEGTVEEEDTQRKKKKGEWMYLTCNKRVA
jgi:hypothetical protein